MKRVLWGVSVLIAGLALGGCNSAGKSGMVKDSHYDDEVDQEKVVAVNQWANNRGYGVTWVNLPRKARGTKARDD